MDNLNMNLPHNFISLVLNNEIRVEKVTEAASIILKELGGRQGHITGEKVWLIDFVDENHEARLLSKLNEAGFLFVGEPAGWPPAEVFDYLREKGLVNGKFTEISWVGSGKWQTRVR